MSTGAPSAVFFLGSRAHYQVLQQPETQFDAENGNTELYQSSPSAYTTGYSVLDDGNVSEDKDKDSLKRRQRAETVANEMKPAQLNNVGNGNASPKESRSRRSLLAFLSSLSRRKKRLDDLQYLQHVESVLTTCTYRESCRCLECQSTYFDCDLDDEYCESDDDIDSEYSTYLQQAQRREESSDDDDEVFVDQVPSDNTSTDVLLEKKMSISSSVSEPEPMDLEVAAGTPLLLNFLLTHPVTCAIQ